MTEAQASATKPADWRNFVGRRPLPRAERGGRGRVDATAAFSAFAGPLMPTVAALVVESSSATGVSHEFPDRTHSERKASVGDARIAAS